jgi:rsbT co-antagonist protein RsbR
MTELSGQHYDQSAATLLTLYRVDDGDIERIRGVSGSLIPQVEKMLEKFYDWLEGQPEYEHFFSDPKTLDRVIRLQRDYWKTFLAAEIDDVYIEGRRRVGEAHARISLPLTTYFAAMNMFLELFDDAISKTETETAEQRMINQSIAKMIHLDTAIVVETYNQLIEDTLTSQAKSLMEMSTPVTQIWNGILLLPIVGIIDSKRAREIMNATLDKISETQARIFILDISGVGVVDTAVANHMIKITKATRLMGCECTISGVSPSIAQTMVDLGIDVGRIKTTSTMKDALEDAFRKVGMEIKDAG